MSQFFVKEYGLYYPSRPDTFRTRTEARRAMRQASQESLAYARRRGHRAFVQVVSDDHRIIRLGTRQFPASRCDVWNAFCVTEW